MPVIFITGIDTGTGKSVATGLLARFLMKRGKSVITQKLVQTGCTGISDDIRVHREIMGTGPGADDLSGLTSPYVLSLAASPHLAAEREGKLIDTGVITAATDILSSRYDIVLLEGAGGIYVPLGRGTATIDYVRSMGYPVIVVTSHRLGSINHTLLTLEALKSRDMPLLGLLYNRYPPADPVMSRDSAGVMKEYLKRWGLKEILVEIPEMSAGNEPDIDFTGILGRYLEDRLRAE